MSPLYVGVDVSNARLDVCFLNQELRLVRPAASFDNDPQGWSALRTAAVAAARLLGPHSRIIAGMESTANMHLGLATALRQEGRCPVEVHVLHPASVKHFRRVLLKDSKTDRIDAQLIATYLVRMAPKPTEPLAEGVEELRIAIRARRGLVEARTQAKNQLHRLLRQYFPGYRGLVGKCISQRLCAVLAAFPSPALIMALPLEELTRLKSGPRHTVGQAFAEKLYALAAQAPRPQLPPAMTLLIRGAAKRVLELAAQIAEMDEAIEALAEQVFPEQTTLLTSIPGLGTVSAAAILAEIGAVSRFPSKDHFVGYCGLYPVVWQSGEVTSRFGRMTWKGNRMLKTTLLVASASARQFNPAIAAYYERLRGRDKSKRAAGGAIARKLAELVFTILTTGKPWSAEIAGKGLTKGAEMAKGREKKEETACLTE